MLKSLIENQVIRIDAHQWGTGKEVLWDSDSADIHIDKETNSLINGKRVKVRIRVPINSDRRIEVEIINKVRKKNQILKIAERRILREIERALSNPITRKAFIDEVLALLKNYRSETNNLERTRAVIKRLSTHFGLSLDIDKEIIGYTNERQKEIYSLTQIFSGNYFVSINTDTIMIGQYWRAVPKNRFR